MHSASASESCLPSCCCLYQLVYRSYAGYADCWTTRESFAFSTVASLVYALANTLAVQSRDLRRRGAVLGRSCRSFGSQLSLAILSGSFCPISKVGSGRLRRLAPACQIQTQA